jgi:hypothetical protein
MILSFSLSILTVVTGTPSALSRGRMMPPENRHGFRLGELLSGGVRKTRFQRDGVGLIEAQAADAKPVIDRAHDDAGFRVDSQVVLVMRLAGGIESVAETETSLGLGLGGIDIEPREDEITARSRNACRRQTGDGLKAARNARKEAAAFVLASAEEVKTARHDDEDSQYGAPDQENPPNHFPLQGVEIGAVAASL